jgi:hypothetical protein
VPLDVDVLSCTPGARSVGSQRSVVDRWSDAAAVAGVNPAGLPAQCAGRKDLRSSCLRAGEERCPFFATVSEVSTYTAVLRHVRAAAGPVVVVAGNWATDYHAEMEFIRHIAADVALARRHRYVLLCTIPEWLPDGLDSTLRGLAVPLLRMPTHLPELLDTVAMAAGRTQAEDESAVLRTRGEFDTRAQKCGRCSGSRADQMPASLAAAYGLQALPQPTRQGIQHEASAHAWAAHPGARGWPPRPPHARLAAHASGQVSVERPHPLPVARSTRVRGCRRARVAHGKEGRSSSGRESGDDWPFSWKREHRYGYALCGSAPPGIGLSLPRLTVPRTRSRRRSVPR